MKYSLILTSLMIFSLGACTAPEPEPLPPLDSSTPIYGAPGDVEYVTNCKPQEAQKLLWQPVSVLASSRDAARARIIRPNMMVTQDYRPERLNIVIGVSERIERVYCG